VSIKGTGKTYLAVARAVEALEASDVRRIILVRPAVEAGEKLGFLPGDMNEKIDPYLRPIYDALYEMLGFDKVEKLLNKNIIEVAPLAFMRGRTLNEAFIILDGTKMMRRTSEASKASTARATARYERKN
jgi:phosphate starvation-inducible PhoH-like protein